MKTGRLLTAVQLMVKLHRARAGEEPATDVKGNYLEHHTLDQLEEMVRSGQWRHRGKGRGGIIHNHLGKIRPPKFLPHQGKREIARRAKRLGSANPFQLERVAA